MYNFPLYEEIIYSVQCTPLVLFQEMYTPAHEKIMYTIFNYLCNNNLSQSKLFIPYYPTLRTKNILHLHS